MTAPGRPKADIDWAVVGKLLEAGCAGTDIASQFGISVATLRVRCKQDNNLSFSAFCQQKRQSGDNLLRAKQYQTAMSGNTTMLIWLGKQRLGQSDKNELTGKDGGRLVIEVVRREHNDQD